MQLNSGRELSCQPGAALPQKPFSLSGLQGHMMLDIVFSAWADYITFLPESKIII
jgi:hypothetical protein